MLQIRDVMTRDVLTVTPETTLREAAELFARRHVGGAPVVAGRMVVGVVSASDVLDYLASQPTVLRGDESGDLHDPDALDDVPADEDDEGDEPRAAFFTDLWGDGAGPASGVRFAETEQPEWDPLAEATAAEVMTKAIHSISAHLPVAAAADLMVRLRVHRLLVTEDGRLVGIITAFDVTRVAAEQRVGARSYVFDRSLRVPPRGRVTSDLR